MRRDDPPRSRFGLRSREVRFSTRLPRVQCEKAKRPLSNPLGVETTETGRDVSWEEGKKKTDKYVYYIIEDENSDRTAAGHVTTDFDIYVMIRGGRGGMKQTRVVAAVIGQTTWERERIVIISVGFKTGATQGRFKLVTPTPRKKMQYALQINVFHYKQIGSSVIINSYKQ